MDAKKDIIEHEVACIKCKSKMTYIRRKTFERICRTCGFVTKVRLEELK